MRYCISKNKKQVDRHYRHEVDHGRVPVYGYPDRRHTCIKFDLMGFRDLTEDEAKAVSAIVGVCWWHPLLPSMMKKYPEREVHPLLNKGSLNIIHCPHSEADKIASALADVLGNVTPKYAVGTEGV